MGFLGVDSLRFKNTSAASLTFSSAGFLVPPAEIASLANTPRNSRFLDSLAARGIVEILKSEAPEAAPKAAPEAQAPKGSPVKKAPRKRKPAPKKDKS